MLKNISNKKYFKLEKKYKCLKLELDEIKNTNMYFYANKMPIFIQKWLFSMRNNINILEIKKENINQEIGKISFIINTNSYINNLDRIIEQIINLMYINYEVYLLCDKEEKYKKYLNIDERIKIIEFSNLKEKNNIFKNINQINSVTNSEYILYLSNFNLSPRFVLNDYLKKINRGIDLIIFKSKLNDTSYALFCKRQHQKSVFGDLKVNTIKDLEQFEKYKNVKIFNER